VLDDVDRRLLAALAVDGRASWSSLGAAARCSASTAQRRWTRLRDAGMATVIGASDVLAAGFGVSAMVRMGCSTQVLPEVVARLRTRREVRFLATLTGTADCVAEVVVPDFADLEPFLTELAPDVDLRTEALPVLRTFTVPFAAFLDDAGTTPASAGATSDSPEAGTANAAAPDLHAMDGVVPVTATATQLERDVFERLVVDGRIPVVDLAAAVGRSEPTTKRAVESLVADGRVRIGPLVVPRLMALRTELMVWISVAPDLVGDAARQLARHPLVHYAAATAGRFNVIGQAFLPTFADVYDFSTAVLGALPGVREVDLTVQMTTHKRMWQPITDGRFDIHPDHPSLGGTP